MYNEHTHFFRDQCVFNISYGKDKGNLGGNKEKGVEKFECHVTSSKPLRNRFLKNKMLHERKKWGVENVNFTPLFLRNVNTKSVLCYKFSITCSKEILGSVI